MILVFHYSSKLKKFLFGKKSSIEILEIVRNMSNVHNEDTRVTSIDFFIVCFKHFPDYVLVFPFFDFEQVNVVLVSLLRLLL